MMAAVVRNLFPVLLGLTVANKKVLQQWSGTFFTLADSLHVRAHVLVHGCEVLGVEELVHLHPPPHAVLLLASSSSSTLNHC